MSPLTDHAADALEPSGSESACVNIFDRDLGDQDDAPEDVAARAASDQSCSPDARPISGGMVAAAADIATQFNLPPVAVPQIITILFRHGQYEDEILTVEEFAAEFKISPDLVSDLCESGKLPAANPRMGKHNNFRIRRSAGLALMHHPEVPPPPAPREKPAKSKKLKKQKQPAPPPAPDYERIV